jgi:aspartyl-tRNA(Asn)/glutamyl-tRNA(Gln) amidotransferase subunit B
MSLIEGRTGEWEVVIGLEVHAQVISNAKLFSGASTAFGAAPNSQVSLVDAAMPGMLPVINARCIEQAVRTGLGLKAEINLVSVFDRKNYFYPDLPQGYQISQFGQPIVGKGEIVLDMPDGATRTVGITRLHLEQDAGKSIHDRDPKLTYVDLNRSGVALMEIVSEPDMRSAEEASAYLTKLRSILRYLGTCDGNMEEGSMRCDANVSVRKPGGPLNTRCEIKNVNSVRSLGRAIEYEAKRQIALHEAGEPVVQQTRHWDENDSKTHTLRSKEDADDYRYFLEPDLVVVDPDVEWIERVRESLPMLPAARRIALAEASGQPADSESVLLVVERNQDRYVMDVGRVGGDVALALKHVKESPDTSEHVGVDRLSSLTKMEANSTVTATQAKTVLEAMIAGEHDGDPEAIATALGYEAMDVSELESMVDAAIAGQPDAWEKFRAGEGKAMGALVGAVMKASKGQADGKAVTALLHQKKG